MDEARTLSMSRYLDVEANSAGPLTPPSLRTTARTDWK
jgi:hypothetical protein